MNWLCEAANRHRMLGTREFYVPQRHVLELLRLVLASSTTPDISINRHQVGSKGLVHKVKWQGLTFISVTLRPIVVG